MMSIEHDIQMVWKVAFKYKKDISFGNIIDYLKKISMGYLNHKIKTRNCSMEKNSNKLELS